MTRSCYRVIAGAASWKSWIYLSDQAREELQWWLANLEKINGFNMKTDVSISPLFCSQVLHGDASGTGVFLGQLRDNRETLLSEPFNETEREKSSTFREVAVFHKFYKSDQVENWRGKSILHYTDNAAVARILSYGSRNPEIQRMVFEITIICRNLGISISADWMSREEEEMKLADLGSRGPWFPLDEFQLDFDMMEMIFSNYNFSLDGFATRLNAVVKRYISRAYEPEAVGTDFFNFFYFPW